jgi:hypothetical protein
MGIINRFLVVTFVLLLLSSLIVHVVTPVSAQAGYKPTVPQISSIKLVDSSYDVSPSTTTTVDQYTGKKTTTTTPGYRVEQRSIEVTIKNQPFISYTNEYDLKVNLQYIVQVKGHFGEDWKGFGYGYLVQSNSGYTVTSYPVEYAAGSQLDFRVQAVIYYHHGIDSERSDWSKVQIYTIPASSPSQAVTLPPPSTTSNGDNSQPQSTGQTQPFDIFTNPFFLFVVGVLFAGIAVTVVMLILRRHTKTLTYHDNSTQTNTNTELSSST